MQRPFHTKSEIEFISKFMSVQ